MNTIKDIEASLQLWNNAYRRGEPMVSDTVYDTWLAKLQKLDPENPYLHQLEPAPVSGSRKTKLPIPMKSLNKVKTFAELKAWAASLGLHDCSKVVCMPKYDGLSMLHNEINGKTYTRGGAENEGQDCTAHYRVLSQSGFGNMSEIFKPEYTFGEFVISRDSWKMHFAGKTSELTGDVFKSPRNTAAGFLNRDEPCDRIRFCEFVRYGSEAEYIYDNYYSFERYLTDMQNAYNSTSLFHANKLGNLSEELLEVMFNTWNERYPIDGIVVYVNDIHIWKAVGRHKTTGNPLYAIAYKSPNFTDTFVTTVKDISWKISKGGFLKPVVNIDAVNTGDCIMENPTGYNAMWILDHKIAKGAEIEVTRSGGVIPKILTTVSPASPQQMAELEHYLQKCPCCGSPTKWSLYSTSDLVCPNPYCPDKKLAEIVHFYSTVGAGNIGEETLRKIYNAGYCTLASILDITENEVMSIDGFGKSTAVILTNANAAIREGIDLATLMHASNCFEGVGKIKAQKVLDQIPDIQDVLDKSYIPQGTFKTMDEATRTVYCAWEIFAAFLKVNDLTPKLPEKVAVNINGQFAGWNVCFSGVRDAELEKRIVQEGGIVSSGVSKKTTHLIVKDKSATSSKIAKAQALGVTILNISEI